MVNTLHPITRHRFNALTFAKHPGAALMAEEVEWWADNDERVLGTIFIDFEDEEWNCIVLGRDEKALFRYIDGQFSLATPALARNALRALMLQASDSGLAMFEQSDITSKKTEIFRVANKLIGRTHRNFDILTKDRGHAAARKIIQEIAYAYTDLDGNFVEQFQTTGFHARLWELYLHAYLHESLFISHRRHDRPDYEVEKFSGPLFIECVTVNPNPDFDPPFAPTTPAQVEELNRDYTPIKFGSPLFSKLQKRYWELPHVTGKPLLIAIHDFHENEAMTWTSPGLSQYLYGLRFRPFFDAKGKLHVMPEAIESHTYKGKTIPSGFFKQAGAENIAGVLFSSSATLAKFNRMGTLAGFGDPDVVLMRAGTRYDHDPNAAVPKPFFAYVKPGDYEESWGEGLSLYHNPGAIHPVDPRLFPGIAHHYLKDGQQVSMLPEFFPYGSITSIIVPTD